MLAFGYDLFRNNSLYIIAGRPLRAVPSKCVWAHAHRRVRLPLEVSPARRRAAVRRARRWRPVSTYLSSRERRYYLRWRRGLFVLMPLP